MKTTCSARKVFVSLFLYLHLLLLATACQQNEPEKSVKDRVKKSVKAPGIDLPTAIMTDNLEALRQHIEAGSRLNEKDPIGGSSPLILAALFGRTAMAQLLIEAGADLNLQNKEGSTALHTAAFFCRPEMVKLLLQKKADKTIRNNYGSTAYEAVAAPFTAVKGVYDMAGKMLAPMGLKLDYTYIEKTRPEIAALLQD